MEVEVWEGWIRATRNAFCMTVQRHRQAQFVCCHPNRLQFPAHVAHSVARTRQAPSHRFRRDSSQQPEQQRRIHCHGHTDIEPGYSMPNSRDASRTERARPRTYHCRTERRTCGWVSEVDAAAAATVLRILCAVPFYCLILYY